MIIERRNNLGCSRAGFIVPSITCLLVLLMSGYFTSILTAEGMTVGGFKMLIMGIYLLSILSYIVFRKLPIRKCIVLARIGYDNGWSVTARARIFIIIVMIYESSVIFMTILYAIIISIALSRLLWGESAFTLENIGRSRMIFIISMVVVQILYALINARRIADIYRGVINDDTFG